MSPSGTKQTSQSHRRMSAFGGKADIERTLWLGWNNCRARPIFWKKLHEQYAKRDVRVIVSSMCEAPRFKEVVPRTIDRHIPSFSEGEFSGKHVSNSRTNMVMHA